MREDAPEGLRIGLLQILHDEIHLTYNDIRDFTCRALRTFPDRANWSEIPNVRDEVNGYLQTCEWFQVYDIIEAACRYLAPRPGLADTFAQRINELFEEEGIGWQMVNGEIVTRGPAEFEHAVAEAVARVEEAGYQTVRRELEEARRDLSRRPEPDITGTVQHCMAALECTARELSNEPGATLGQIINRHAADLGIPRPLDNAIERMWGYASEMGRHLREGREPGREEAELLLSLSATLINYLLQRHGQH